MLTCFLDIDFEHDWLIHRGIFKKSQNISEEYKRTELTDSLLDQTQDPLNSLLI